MMKEKIRVLHCLETVLSGGVEQRRLSIARLLPKDRYEQILTCSKAGDALRQKFESNGVMLYPLGPLKKVYNLRYYLALFKVVRKFKPHIIHGAVFEGVISAVVAGLFFRIPVIVVEETSDPAHRSDRGHALLKFLVKFSDKIVATSPAVHSYLTNKLGISNSKVQLILNGVERPAEPSEEDVSHWRQKLGLTSGDFIVGSVGRMLDPVKRFSDLIRALKLLEKSCPEAKLLLVGDGPDRQQLQNMAKDLQLESRVIFAGYQHNTSIFYRLMDVFALVSEQEGFGMAVVESMFFGLPVIGTSVGGIQNIVQDGKTGHLIPPHNPMAIANAIMKVYSDRAAQRELGINGRKRALENFSAERYVTDLDTLYSTLLKERSLI